MPLITRRSSTRFFPRMSLGKYGSICRHCSSLSQNKLRRIFSAPNHSDQRISNRFSPQRFYWVLTLNNWGENVMPESDPNRLGRRNFLGRAALTAGTIGIAPELFAERAKAAEPARIAQ